MIDIHFFIINFHLIKLMIIKNNNRIFKTIVNGYNYDFRSNILKSCKKLVNEAVKTRHNFTLSFTDFMYTFFKMPNNCTRAIIVVIIIHPVPSSFNPRAQTRHLRVFLHIKRLPLILNLIFHTRNRLV